MLKYICGGLGVVSLGLGFQQYIAVLQPYSLYFIFGGLILFFVPLAQKLFHWVRKKHIRIQPQTTDTQSSSGSFPVTEYLTGQDIMTQYGFSPFILKQHIENGLVGYLNDGSMQNKKLRQITHRELIADEVYEEDLGSEIGQWLFKSEDLEKYIKNI